MKKVVCLVLSFLMMLQTVTFASEGYTDEFENLVITAKTLLEIDEAKYVFDSYRKNDDTLNLTWISRNEEEGGYINVVIDTEGDILSYSIDSISNEKYDILTKPSDDLIKYEAENFVKKIAPNKGKYFKAETVSSYLNTNYDGVSFTRYQNEILVAQSSCYVEINPYTMRVSHYNMNWSNIDSFETTEGILSPSEAIAAYKENLGYELLYRTYNDNDEVKSYLTYSPIFSSQYSIDAKTGKVYSASIAYKNMMSNAAMESAKDEVSLSGGSLSKEEQLVYDELKNLPSKDEVIAYAKSILEFNITDDFIIESFAVYKDSNEKYIANMRFLNNTEEKNSYKYLSLYLDTYEIVSYSYYNYLDDKEKYSDELLKETAEAFADKYFAKRISGCIKNEDYTGGAKYQRIENGIKVNGEGVTIGVDAESGEISNVNLNWSDIEFEKITPEKSLEDLYEKIINEDTFRLSYTLILSDEKPNRKYTAKLIYSLLTNDYYDVNTLEPLNYKGQVQEKTEFTGYTDIDNHYVKEYAIALGKMGVFYGEDKMRPDETATQKDFISLLAKANGYQTEDISYFYKRAHERYFGGDDIDENAPLKRIDAIRYAVNYKGYEEIAKISSMFKTHFTDVSDDMVGYASLAAGLKIVSDKPDKLNGENLLTRAEALVIVFNLLNN